MRIPTFQNRPFWRDPVWGLGLTLFGGGLSMPLKSTANEPNGSLWLGWILLASGGCLLLGWLIHGVRELLSRK